MQKKDLFSDIVKAKTQTITMAGGLTGLQTQNKFIIEDWAPKAEEDDKALNLTTSKKRGLNMKMTLDQLEQGDNDDMNNSRTSDQRKSEMNESLQNRQLHKLEQDALKNEIEDMLNKISDGKEEQKSSKASRKGKKKVKK